MNALNVGNWFHPKEEFPLDDFIPVDRNAILAMAGRDRYKVLAEIAACQCIREDIVAVLADGSIAKDVIILSKDRLEEEIDSRRTAVQRVLSKRYAVREDIVSYSSNISLETAVEIEMRKTKVEKDAQKLCS